MLRKNPLSVNIIVLIVQCRRGVKDMFAWQRQKTAFLGLLQVYFAQLGQNISNKFNFGVKFFMTHFSKFLFSPGRISEMFVHTKSYF